MGEVKQYYIMESAVKPMSDGAPCCTATGQRNQGGGS